MFLCTVLLLSFFLAVLQSSASACECNHTLAAATATATAATRHTMRKAVVKGKRETRERDKEMNWT